MTVPATIPAGVLRYDTAYETIDDPTVLEEYFDEDAKMRNPAGT